MLKIPAFIIVKTIGASGGTGAVALKLTSDVYEYGRRYEADNG